MKNEMYHELAERIEYSPENGALTWRYRADKSANWNTRYAGKVAGTVNKNDGYRYIRTVYNGEQKNIPAHRLAFFIVNGKEPERDIDHINGLRIDNSEKNLREVTRSLNQRNRGISSRNSTGASGVFWEKRRLKWRAQVVVKKVAHHLGYFESKQKAGEVVSTFRAQNGFTDRHGQG
jgi:hypothetical protein